MKFLEEETINLRKNMMQHGVTLEFNIVDYVFYLVDDYQGEASHKLAAIKGIEQIDIFRNIRYDRILNFRAIEKGVTVEELLKSIGKEDKTLSPSSIIPDKMKAALVNSNDFFKEHDYRERNNDDKYKEIEESYYRAFVYPPYGTSTGRKDFPILNQLLFPNKNDLIIYRWNDDWSSYFDAGKEWWGTFFWTIYDPSSKRMTVVGASATD